MNQGKHVVVTGLGVMCAVGNRTEEVLHNLEAGNLGIDTCSLFDTSKLRSPFCGEIKKDMVYEERDPMKDTRFSTIAKIVLQELLEDSKLSKSDLEQLYERAIVSAATSVGANAHLIEHIKDRNENMRNPYWLACYPEYITKTFSEILGVHGAYYVNNSACSAGTTAAGTAFSMIRAGKADIGIVIGVDPLTEFSYYGFHSLKNISVQGCNPFDVTRDGLTLGEGGAALVFEEYEHAKARNAHIYCEVFGYGMGNDAYHTTSPDPTGEGAYRVMKMALEDGKVSESEIDYVNAHGTGTDANDEMEILAINKLFNATRQKVYVNSIKGLTGHCLAAAGTIELLSTVLSIDHQVVFPMPKLVEGIKTKENIILVKNQAVHTKIDYALSNSFAFGGNASSILIGKCRN